MRYFNLRERQVRQPLAASISNHLSLRRRIIINYLNLLKVLMLSSMLKIGAWINFSLSIKRRIQRRHVHSGITT